MTADRDELAKVLGEHTLSYWSSEEPDSTRCKCGWRGSGFDAHRADVILADFERLAERLGYANADKVRAARLSALSNAADVVHAEARWQWELDSRGHIGAQIVAQRMQVVEACLRAFAGEAVADADTP